MEITQEIEDRFWDLADKSLGPLGCWLWTGKKLKAGYGGFYLGKDRKRKPIHTTAHRLALFLSGATISSGLYACHRCDNPPCVNPAHLFYSTPKVNVNDAILKGRIKNRGEDNFLCKLKDSQVTQIRSLRASGASLAELSKKYACSEGNVSLICNFKTRIPNRDYLHE